MSWDIWKRIVHLGINSSNNHDDGADDNDDNGDDEQQPWLKFKP